MLAGAGEQMTALRRVGKERCVVHVKRVESALSKKGCILLVRGRLEGVAEEVKGNVRVEGSSTGNAPEALVRQPAPAGAVVGEGEVRRLRRSVAQFTWQSGCVCRQIGEGDELAAFRYNRAGWSEALERVVEAHGLVRDEFGEDVGGKDLCERAEPQQRVLSGKLMGTGRSLAISAKKNLIVANDDQNHTGRA